MRSNKRMRKCFLASLEYTIYEQTEERIFWSNMTAFVNQNIIHQTNKKRGVLDVNTRFMCGRYYK